MRALRWAYGVTTVPERRDTYLQGTLASLKLAGFDSPRLFVDGDNDIVGWRQQFNGLEVTSHYPRIRTYGNWILALAELFIRNPAMHRYAIFQDDLVTYPNLRKFLDAQKYPERGYWNLHTFLDNENVVRDRPQGWYESSVVSKEGGGNTYHGKMQQTGRSAVALVFDREAVVTLLTHQHIVRRPMDANRGWRFIDGGVVEAMNQAGYREYVYNPSLVSHTGLKSAMGNHPYKPAASFRGESYDATNLLREVPRCA